MDTALKSSITWLCLFRRSTRLSLIPLVLVSRMAGLRKRPFAEELWEGWAEIPDPAPFVSGRCTDASVVSICRGALPLCLASADPSSTQSAGVGGILSSPVPSTGGGRVRVVRTADCEWRKEEASDRPLTLCDLVEEGGGPGGGGGRGIPGSHPPPGGERLRDWLVALDVLALPTIGPAETARREAGGRDMSSY